MPSNPLNRRQFLSLSGLAAVGAASSCTFQGNDQAKLQVTDRVPDENYSNSKRALRIALMTDFHLLPESNVVERGAQAFRHAQSQADAPHVIFNTGDSIMDSLLTGKNQAEKQWQAYNDLLKAECKLPIYHAIGNHDVWGWGNSDPQRTSDAEYGKNMALQKLNLEKPYYSFDLAGWHFIFLDSTHEPNEVSREPYIGMVDEAQFAWMEGELEKTPADTNICVLSHIPILCACEVFDGQNEASGNWVIPAAWMHIDARRFRQLFLKHSNVRLCLSGHAHQYESLDYLGVRYITGGAVCGNWWMGAYMDFPPAYVMIDLYEDGCAESAFMAF